MRKGISAAQAAKVAAAVRATTLRTTASSARVSRSSAQTPASAAIHARNTLFSRDNSTTAIRRYISSVKGANPSETGSRESTSLLRSFAIFSTAAITSFLLKRYIEKKEIGTQHQSMDIDSRVKSFQIILSPFQAIFAAAAEVKAISYYSCVEIVQSNKDQYIEAILESHMEVFSTEVYEYERGKDAKGDVKSFVDYKSSREYQLRRDDKRARYEKTLESGGIILVVVDSEKKVIGLIAAVRADKLLDINKDQKLREFASQSENVFLDKIYAIDQLFVLQEARSSGIGRKLISKVEELVVRKDPAIERIVVRTLASDINTRVLNFYQRMNFYPMVDSYIANAEIEPYTILKKELRPVAGNNAIRTIIIEGKEQYEAYKRENGLEGIGVLAQALIHKGGMTASDYDQHLTRRFDAGDNLKLFFLIDKSNQGKIVAAAMGWPFGTIQNGPRIHIQALSVVKEMRRRGLGIGILKQVQQYCLDNGFKGFDLDVGTRSLEENCERYLGYGAAPKKTLFSIEATQEIRNPTPVERERQNDSVQAILKSFGEVAAQQSSAGQESQPSVEHSSAAAVGSQDASDASASAAAGSADAVVRAGLMPAGQRGLTERASEGEQQRETARPRTS